MRRNVCPLLFHHHVRCQNVRSAKALGNKLTMSITSFLRYHSMVATGRTNSRAIKAAKSPRQSERVAQLLLDGK
jgi:hypothetical protein